VASKQKYLLKRESIRLMFRYVFLLFSGLVLIVCLNRASVWAQEDVYRLAGVETFDALRRPAVDFPHDTHESSLGDDGCIVCHHDYDADSDQLVYYPGEEQPCRECHEAKHKSGKPGLRQAYHGSCTACHRQRIKASQTAGPTTCGGCHPKP